VNDCCKEVDTWGPIQACHCTVCHVHFHSMEAFDIHRYGPDESDGKCHGEDFLEARLGYFGSRWGTDADFSRWAKMQNARVGK
jgi:hypothetical protein